MIKQAQETDIPILENILLDTVNWLNEMGQPLWGADEVPLTLFNRRLSDYINTLATAGFAVERIVEETDMATLERDTGFSSEYYAPCKAKRFPLSLIVKARKL